MKQRSLFQGAAVFAAAALIVTGCGGSSGGGSGQKGAENEFNAGSQAIRNPSTVKGGTLNLISDGDCDYYDPARTYLATAGTSASVLQRGLMGFKAEPGVEGLEVASGPRQGQGVTTDAKTWTYRLRPGLKYEDGTVITSKDVKYGIERSLDKATFPNGPTYWNDFLVGAATYSPYKNKAPGGLASIETPDDSTIVFPSGARHSAGWTHFAQLLSIGPVPQPSDTGAKYKEHVISSGPYMFKTNNAGKNFVLVRNPNWSAASDPNRKALPDEIDVALNVNANDIDQRLLAGDLDVAVTGVGVGSAAQGQILGNPQQKASADAAASTRLWFTVLNSDVAPLNNIHCRKAIELAADKTGYQRAYGGSVGGDIATSLLPSLIPGAQKIDLYEAAAQPSGDDAKAKQELTACGQPNGFATNVSYRAERPKEKATAEALQQSLAKVGIKLTIKPYPLADYAKLYAGKPDYAKSNKLGLIIYGWAADWPDGFGFLSQIVDSRVIRAAGGNTNLGIKIPAADALIDKALATTDKAAREQIWGQIDKTVMENAAVLPGVWAKGLLYRPSNLTNVFVNPAFGQYDYAAIGTTKK